MVGRSHGFVTSIVRTAARADWLSVGHPSVSPGLAAPALPVVWHDASVRWPSDHAVRAAGPVRAGRRPGRSWPSRGRTGVFACWRGDAHDPDRGTGTGRRSGARACSPASDCPPVRHVACRSPDWRTAARDAAIRGWATASDSGRSGDRPGHLVTQRGRGLEAGGSRPRNAPRHVAPPLL